MSIATFEGGDDFGDFHPEYQRRELLKDGARCFVENGQRCNTFVLDNPLFTLSILGGTIVSNDCPREELNHTHGVAVVRMTNRVFTPQTESLSVIEQCAGVPRLSHAVPIVPGPPEISADPGIAAEMAAKDAHARYLINTATFTPEDTYLAGRVLGTPNRPIY